MNRINQNAAMNLPCQGLITPENKILGHITADSDLLKDLNEEQVFEEKRQKVKKKYFNLMKKLRGLV